MKKITLTLIFCLFAFINLQAQAVSGELKRWHKITIDFEGPNTSETANPNPFLDYRLDVSFTHSGTGKTYVVPGFYSGCVNPAENSCNSGKIWKVHFTPDRTGSWSWSASFKKGNDVAANGGGTSAGFMDGSTGNFNVVESDKSGRDHRAANKGRTAYVGEHYLRYVGTGGDNANGDWFVKAGADAPENSLAYDDFDNTPNRGNRRKNWNPHQQDFNASDAGSYTWSGGKGSELLGVVNYLSTKGVNAFSFLTLSLHGDDENVFPHLLKVPVSTYNGYNDEQQWSQGVHKDRFDVSKLAQWDRIFQYADKKGMFMHFKTMETENDNIMDGNNFGKERKLYYRELIARFGYHLSLNWNLTEETTLQDDVAIATTNYIKSIDPYDHLIVMHTYPGRQTKNYTPLLGNKSSLTGTSIQMDKGNVHEEVKEWVGKSSEAGKKWVVANDEQGNANIGVDVDPKDEKLVRHKVLWGTLTAGGAGVEYYYGYQTGETDLSAQNHRSRDKKYSQAAYALNFINTYLQKDLVDMVSSDDITSDNGDYVFSKGNHCYVVYRPEGGTTDINLPSGNWKVRWYNPRNGGELSNPTNISNSINAPDTNDWVGLITKSSTEEDITAPIISLTGSSTVNLTVGDTYVEQGATATDNVDGNLTSSIVVSGNVNTNVPGTYTVKYNVSDTAGNAADEVSRTIILRAEGDCSTNYEERNGLVVIETENLNIASGWINTTSVNGYTGTGYLDWQGADSFGTPGNGTIKATIKINEPGTYLFQWRSKVGEGNNSTESNDSWLRFPDADDFFAQKGNNIIYPKGSGKTPNPNGAGAEGWFKVYISGTTNWTWSTNTSDNDPHKIYVRFNSAGVYTMEVSGRSKHHLIDRIVLSKDVDDATNLSLNETLCSGNSETIPVTSVTLSPQTASIEEGDNITLVAQVLPENASNKNITWSSSDTAIASVDQNGKVTAQKEGNVVITVKTEDGDFTKTANITVAALEGDTTAPVISLIGESTINLSVGDTYEEQGATATDAVDGDITSDIAITGNVNTNEAGEYILAYNVNDAAGNAANEVTRTIIVSLNCTVGASCDDNDAATVNDVYDADCNCAGTIVTETIQSPYQGTNALIPGKIEAENYDLGGQGVAYFDSSEGNNGNEYRDDNVDIRTIATSKGGYQVGWSVNGEWMEYTTNVTAGEYDIELRASSASANPGAVKVELDGVSLGVINIESTGSYDTFKSFVIPNIVLTGGSDNVLRLSYEGNDFDIDWIQFSEVEDNEDTTAPVITLVGESTINLTVGDTYTEQGATATDDIDGDLTSNIVISGVVNTDEAGEYTITYNVSDVAGNAADEVTRTIIVSEEEETTAPVITLIGESTINLTVGDTYTEQGATATDSIDGDLTSSIIISGAVNTDAAGEYTVTYNVSDAAGNVADEVTRTVIVLSNSGNQLPTFSGIRDRENLAVGSSILPVVNTYDTDGSVANVRLFINGEFIRSEFEAPYEWGHKLNYDAQLKNLQEGAYKLRAEIRDKVSGVTVITLDFTVSGTTTNEYASLLPIHDAYLEEDNRRYNTGIVRVENNRRVAYLMFDVSQFKSNVSNVVLQFKVASDPGYGNVNVYLGTSNDWTENNLNRSNKPGIGELLGSIDSRYAIGSVIEIPLKNLSTITGDRLSLILEATDGNDFAFSSKESRTGNAPILKFKLPVASKFDVLTTNPSSNIVTLEDDSYQENKGLIIDDIKVYPNPSSDRVTLNRVENENTALWVYDVYGKVVLQKVVSPTAKTIEISELSSGLYYIFLDGLKRAKFIRK